MEEYIGLSYKQILSSSSHKMNLFVQKRKRKRKKYKQFNNNYFCTQQAINEVFY